MRKLIDMGDIDTPTLEPVIVRPLASVDDPCPIRGVFAPMSWVDREPRFCRRCGVELTEKMKGWLHP